jgi:hypothetical protein
MIKFKVGNRVRILEPKDKENYLFTWVKEMQEMVGKVYPIDYIHQDRYITVNGWMFMPESLELVDEEIMEKTVDLVNEPPHYKCGDDTYEAIKIIEAHDLNFSLGNAVKYILRCNKKGNKKQDLEKAIWNLNREINKI